MSNILPAAFDGARRRVALAARRALPQRCQLCAAPSADALICTPCGLELRRPPPSCPVCATPTPGAAVCGACLAHPPPYAATVAAYIYAFPLDRLIRAFKYRARLALGEWCAHALAAEVLARALPLPQCVVALPLHRARQRERGHNHAFEIARPLSAALGVPVAATALTRVRPGVPQAALPWSGRAANVRGAFSCDRSLAGLHVAVVDDVMTTGASLAEAARALRRAGVVRVDNWVVARTLPPAGSSPGWPE